MRDLWSGCRFLASLTDDTSGRGGRTVEKAVAFDVATLARGPARDDRP